MEDMLLIIKKYPDMVLDAIEATNKANLPDYKAGEDYNKILICGMGGSAIGGDLLNNLLRDLKRPIESIQVSRQYKLPSNIDRRTLIFCVSYSGNTEETLSQFVEARKAGYKIIAITSDGKLKDWCSQLGIPLVELPLGFAPRAALPYLFIPLVESVADKQLRKDMDEAVKVLEDIREDTKEMDSIERAASLMKDHWIAVYGPAGFEAVARRAKTQINENSKLPATYAVFPELCHNEIVGYEDNDLNMDLYVIILRDETSEDEPMKVRIETIREIIQSRVSGIVELHAVGKSKLARMLSLLYYIDLLSYHIAIASGKAPEKTEHIDKLKDVLRDKINMQEKLEKELA